MRLGLTTTQDFLLLIFWAFTLAGAGFASGVTFVVLTVAVVRRAWRWLDEELRFRRPGRATDAYLRRSSYRRRAARGFGR
jgi:hypothetical protein